MIGRRPVAMAIEQRANDTAIQDAGKRFVFFLGFPFSDDFAVFRKTTNTQAVQVRRAATPARIVRGILFLQ